MAKWREPNNLAQPLPRYLRIKLMPALVVALFPALLLVMLAIIIPLFYQTSARMAALQSTGVTAEGVITGLQAQAGRGKPTYLAHYDFRPMESRDVAGQVQQAESPVTASDFSTLRVGSPVTVRFQPLRPDISELQVTSQTIWARPWENFRFTSIMIVGMFGLVSFLWLLLVGRIWRREHRLMAWGTAAQAWIIAENEVRGRSGTTLTVTYEFEDQSGHKTQGKRSGLPTQDKLVVSRWAALDDAVRSNPMVLYDPKRPSRNMLYPSLFVALKEDVSLEQGVTNP